jgi:hypothetical protein
VVFLDRLGFFAYFEGVFVFVFWQVVEPVSDRALDANANICQLSTYRYMHPSSSIGRPFGGAEMDSIMPG